MAKERVKCIVNFPMPVDTKSFLGLTNSAADLWLVTQRRQFSKTGAGYKDHSGPGQRRQVMHCRVNNRVNGGYSCCIVYLVQFEG